MTQCLKHLVGPGFEYRCLYSAVSTLHTSRYTICFSAGRCMSFKTLWPVCAVLLCHRFLLPDCAFCCQIMRLQAWVQATNLSRHHRRDAPSCTFKVQTPAGLALANSKARPGHHAQQAISPGDHNTISDHSLQEIPPALQ